MFWNFLQSWQSHIHFYISLQPIIGKFLRKVTTLFLKTCQSKLKLHKDLNTFAPQGNLGHFFPRGHGWSQGNSELFSLKDMVTLWGNLGPFFFGKHETFLRINMCLGEQGLMLPCETIMFSKELGPKFLGEHMPWIFVWS